ncbi:MAG: hypothetical protein E7527_02230 [Ruminococcaceae bacterium]|nr:hypothetical protein [Oscillospiraceae bacterium]
MGIFADLRAIANVQKIRNGSTAKLSISQITNLLVNMMDARNNLSVQQYREVCILFERLRKDKKKIKVDYREYLRIALGIIMEFDLIAPYELFCGGDSEEFSLLLNAVRQETRPSADFELSMEEKQYAKELVKKSNGIITEEESIGFVKILLLQARFDKEKIIDAFDDFSYDIVNKCGEISSIAKVSFFIGALNANGIISESEMHEMNDSFNKVIMETLMNKQ